MLTLVNKAAAKKLDDLNKSLTYSCLLLQSPDYGVSGNFGGYLNIFEVKKCNEVRANLAPVGSNAFCSTPCAQEFSSCSPELECWANPASRQFLCCDGQPSASFIPALPPVGSNAQCPVPCTLDASCPPGFECWANPIDQQFRCCNGRP
jgi:hypothetical protein